MLGIVSAISLGVSLLGGITNGIMNAWEGADSRRSQQINELTYQNQQLTNQKNELERRFSVTERETNTQIAESLTERDTNAAFNAQAGVVTNKQAYEEVNNLRLQATQLQGQVQAQNATTGFRDTGTLEKRVEQTDSQISRQIGLAKDRANLTIASTYLSSAQSYNQSTKQAEAYKRQLEESRKQLNYSITEINEQIATNQGTIDELERQNNSFGQWWIDLLEGMF